MYVPVGKGPRFAFPQTSPCQPMSDTRPSKTIGGIMEFVTGHLGELVVPCHWTVYVPAPQIKRCHSSNAKAAPKSQSLKRETSTVLCLIFQIWISTMSSWLFHCPIFASDRCARSHVRCLFKGVQAGFADSRVGLFTPFVSPESVGIDKLPYKVMRDSKARSFPAFLG